MIEDIYICGICGTFMAGIAQIASQQGYRVHGCDQNVYPPMSTLLREQGIEIDNGYLPEHLDKVKGDLIIGNALSRGNALIEAALNQRRHLQSGPEWLHRHVLLKKKTLAIAGTHGKTSTSSMLAWILQYAELEPSFLIGGRPGNFDTSARHTDSEFFVIEADEYDTAFFDKRSKFVHYQPHGVILNNLEFDHADIFDNLAQIKTQFRHLMRLVPENGFVIVNADDANLASVLQMGCYSRRISTSIRDISANWYAQTINQEHSHFSVYQDGHKVAEVTWQCIGDYNMQNALNAIAAAQQCGIQPEISCSALKQFIPSARRLQKLAHTKNTILFEDFAHHPTAINLTLNALKQKYPDYRLIAILEPRSNTMRAGVHQATLGEALNKADASYIYEPHKLSWETSAVQSRGPVTTIQSKQAVLNIPKISSGKTVIVCLSNGSFDSIPSLLQSQLKNED